MFSSLFSFLIIAGLLLTGQTTAVSETPIPRETPIVTQSAPAPTIEASLIEFKEMIDDEPAAGKRLFTEVTTRNNWPTG